MPIACCSSLITSCAIWTSRRSCAEQASSLAASMPCSRTIAAALINSIDTSGLHCRDRFALTRTRLQDGEVPTRAICFIFVFYNSVCRHFPRDKASRVGTSPYGGVGTSPGMFTHRCGNRVLCRHFPRDNYPNLWVVELIKGRVVINGEVPTLTVR